MGLFDGGTGRALGGVFGALYPDALLHRKLRGPDTEGGSATSAFTGEPGQPLATTVKATQDRLTRKMLDAEGYAEGDVGFIILCHYGGIGLPEPIPGDRMTWPKNGGSLYSLEDPIDRDGAHSHWTARGRPVR